MFRLNFKIAFRSLWRNKGFSLINIGGLAIGLACCLLLLLYVHYELSYDRQFKNSDRNYIVKLNMKNNSEVITGDASPPALTEVALQNIPGIAYISRISLAQSEVKKLYSQQENKFKLQALWVDPSFLQIFDYHFIYGNAATALNDPNAAVLTASTAKRLFAGQNPIGKSIKYDNRKLLRVTGVIEDLPKNQTNQFEVLQTWAFYEQEDPRQKGNWGMSCLNVIQLRNNSSFSATDASLRKFLVSRDHKDNREAFLFPYNKFHLYDEFENGKNAGGMIDQVKLFLFLALCVLLIACINYMNLSTAKSEKRGREVGVRKALGSTKTNLMAQFIIESLMLSFFSVMIAFVIVEASLPYFNNLLDIAVQIDYHSFLFWAVIVSLVLFTGFIAGSYPAFYLSSFTTVKVLKGVTGIGNNSLPVRKILVVLQFSLSICMIICAIVIYGQIQFLKNRPLGFKHDNLVQIDLEGEWTKPEKLNLFISELKKAGAISSAVTYSDNFIGPGSATGAIRWPGEAEDDKTMIDVRSAGFDYTTTIGAKVLTGRDFSPKFKADTVSSILLNESAVKIMNLKNPIGTLIRWGRTPMTVVGVVQDHANESLGSKARPTVFYNKPRDARELLIRLNAGQSVSNSVRLIKSISQRLNPAYPPDLQFLSSGMAEKLHSEKLLSILSNLFGGFAIFISCLGLLGLALYMAEQRKKEISIRKVLGAGLGHLMLLLNKDFMKLVLLSNLVAIPVAYILASKWIMRYDYRVTIGIYPFVIALVISLVIAILSVSMQTFKVVKANAVDALKYE
jgi:ABC-type antimicrobial peptide transport system permease subunit